MNDVSEISVHSVRRPLRSESMHALGFLPSLTFSSAGQAGGLSPSELLAMPPYFPASAHPHPDFPPQCRAHAAGPADEDRDFRGRRVGGEDLGEEVCEVGAGVVGDGDGVWDSTFYDFVVMVMVVGSGSSSSGRVFIRMPRHEARPLLEFDAFHSFRVVVFASRSSSSIISSIRSRARTTRNKHPRPLPEVLHPPHRIRDRPDAPHECDVLAGGGGGVPLAEEVAVDGEGEGRADAAGDEEDGGVGV